MSVYVCIYIYIYTYIQTLYMYNLLQAGGDVLPIVPVAMAAPWLGGPSMTIVWQRGRICCGSPSDCRSPIA